MEELISEFQRNEKIPNPSLIKINLFRKELWVQITSLLSWSISLVYLLFYFYSYAYNATDMNYLIIFFIFFGLGWIYLAFPEGPEPQSRAILRDDLYRFLQDKTEIGIIEHYVTDKQIFEEFISSATKLHYSTLLRFIHKIKFQIEINKFILESIDVLEQELDKKNYSYFLLKLPTFRNFLNHHSHQVFQEITQKVLEFDQKISILGV